jgi:GGDEF domain-containing protein
MLPLAETLVALALLRLGRPGEALEGLGEGTADSTSSGARSFRRWVAARVHAIRVADAPALAAFAGYAAVVAADRAKARRALLHAARGHISGERTRVERDRLAVDIALDPLTGLGNRRAFEGWLAREVVEPTPAAMLLIDLDNFKAVNDRYGHSTGDEVLRRVGRILLRHVRAGDLALRLGGDEFAVIMESATEPDLDLDVLADTAAARAWELHRRSGRPNGAT